MKIKNIIGEGIVTLSILFTTIACSDIINYEYSDYHCNLSIDNSVHLDATLASSMNALSSGVFTTIKPLYKDGIYYFYFKNNQGLGSGKTIQRH